MEGRGQLATKVAAGIVALLVLRLLSRRPRWALVALGAALVGQRAWSYLHTPE